MNAEKTDAIVIRLADFSNTSKVVTFFTRDFGKVAAIAKGGKRLKGPFDSGLDLLSESRVVFLRKSSSALDILTEASLTSRFRPHPSNVGGFYAACYMADLLASLTEEDDPHPQLFEAARWSLQHFMQTADYRLSLLRFELVLLREIGQLPAFDECLECGETTSKPGRCSFWVAQGGMLCPNCQKPEFALHQIQAGTIALMQHLSQDSETLAQHLIASPQQLQEVRHTLTAAFSAILGHRPKTLRYLQF